MAEPVKLLYVEDEPFLARIVKESLEARGFSVFHTTDGAKAMSLLEQHRPDVCVLDVMLPNVDGFELAREIMSRHPQLPVLFVTAKTEAGDAVEGLRTGAFDYIRKPFSMEELIVRIENVLRITSTLPAPTTELVLGDYILNTHNQQLSFKTAQPLKLSHRECELLRLLWQNRHSIADRRLILRTLWNDDSYFNSRNLDVYITRLRNYLRSDTRVEIITVKGQGYRFVLPEN
ncbi:MAG: response regulator transcription factor [Bacteroidia bacterium]|jgi:DNA-binding response OmpR family regulator|nr:response regulator transcription factor [Bacteroidia bacterium]